MKGLSRILIIITSVIILVPAFSFISYTTAEGDGILDTSYYWEGKGGYVASGNGTWDASSGTITISDVPSGATIEKAFIYWVCSSSYGLDTNIQLNGNGISGTQVGQDGIFYGYRADVTSLVSGNGDYEITDITTSYGASIVVVFSHSSLNNTLVIIKDGMDSRYDHPIPHWLEGVTFSGFVAPKDPKASLTFIIGDGQTVYRGWTAYDKYSFNEEIIAIDEADGSDGNPTTHGWDTDTYDVSSNISEGSLSVRANIYEDQDELCWIACIFSITPEPPSEQAIFADAGEDQIVNEGETVILDGSNSRCSEGHYWDPNIVAQWHMNEGSGNVIYDKTSNNHDATVLGANWTSDGKFGSALNFDGIDDYIEVGPSDEVFGENPDHWSYCAWFKTTKIGGKMCIISDRNDDIYSDQRFGVDLGIEGTHSDMIWVRYSISGHGMGRNFSIADHKWHFFVVTISKPRNEWNLYFDGEWVVRRPNYLHHPTYDYFDDDMLRIGSRWVCREPGEHGTAKLRHFVNGTLDEVILFDRALTAEEVKILYNINQSQITSYEWDFESDGIFDYQETASNAPDGSFDGKTTHIYGDNGNFTATLRITDGTGAQANDTCNITVHNVDPILEIESATMEVEIGLRVVGRKFNDVGVNIYEDGNDVGYISIERMPGSPDDQMVWIPITLDMTRRYSAKVTFIPEDPPNVGANPTWIYIKFPNGSIQKIHHTFNVQQSKKKGSDHWNHVEPWEVDINSHLIGWEFEVDYHVTDPGSDDELLSFTYGSQIQEKTYLNYPPDPDPDPSPEVNPRNIYDTISMIYEGPGIFTIKTKDDDGGEDTKILHIA